MGDWKPGDRFSACGATFVFDGTTFGPERTEPEVERPRKLSEETTLACIRAANPRPPSIEEAGWIEDAHRFGPLAVIAVLLIAAYFGARAVGWI